jgi:two-component system LytT family sensor kinase
LLITFFVGWIKAQKQKDELEKQSQQAEIALLRSQINPHFLFNTLNNLYSLVYRKSDEAPGALMKLSDILRYMLYESNTEKVLLEKEITYIKSYIELQQLRITTPNFIQFTLKGAPEGKLIPPMLLITFIENAFKHGNKNVDAPGIIINIDCEGGSFLFDIKSYLNESEVQTKDPQQGIGMQNVKRRLELTYRGKHELFAGIEGNTYHVKLNLKEL